MREIQKQKTESKTEDMLKMPDNESLRRDTGEEPDNSFGAPEPEDAESGGSETPKTPPRSKWFGRGIYGSKDVPIRLLDGVIAIFIAAAVILVIIATINGGFQVTFDTGGGSQVASQKLRHGSLVQEPEIPVKPGYTFEGWYREDQPDLPWNFALDKVGGDLKLFAAWTPARITVKFDLNGGRAEGVDSAEPVTVTYLEPYGELPVPEKQGAEFAGWEYSGSIIEPDTVVTMTGEHVLTAQWR